MKTTPLLALALTLMLSACGVETVATAATTAKLKQEELQQGEKNLEQAQQQIDAINQRIQDQNAATQQALEKNQ